MRPFVRSERSTRASRPSPPRSPIIPRRRSRISTRAFEQLVGAKSIEQAIEIQSQYAKKAYDTYIAEMSKLGEMYVGLAKDAYKPVEAALSKKAA